MRRDHRVQQVREAASKLISRANIYGRASVFLLGKGAGILAELIAPSVASFLMAKSPWIPLLVGLSTLVFGTGLILLIPETLNRRVSADGLIPDSSFKHSAARKDKSSIFSATKDQIIDAFKRVYEATTVLHSLPILLLLITFIADPVSGFALDLSLRYISKRFGWELRQTAFLLSLRAFISLALLLAILPGWSFYLTERLHFSSKAKDLSLARYSATLLVIGALIFATSPTIGLTITGLVIYTLGGGFGSLSRALITTMVDKEHIGRLYSAIAVVEIVTNLAAGPSMAGLYAVGLKLKGPWLALPFYALTLTVFMAGLGVWCFGYLMRRPKGEEMPFGDEDRDSIVRNTVFLVEDNLPVGMVRPV